MAKSSWLTSWIGQMHGTHPPLLQRMLPIRKPPEREPAGEPLSCHTDLSTSREKSGTHLAVNMYMQIYLRQVYGEQTGSGVKNTGMPVMSFKLKLTCLRSLLLPKHSSTCSSDFSKLHWKHPETVQTCTMKAMDALPLAKCGSTKNTDTSG